MMHAERSSSRGLGSIIRPLSALVTSAAAGQGLLLLCTPFLAEQYGAQALGIYGQLTSIIVIGVTFASLRFDALIQTVEQDDEADSLSLLALALVPCVAITASLLSLPIFRAGLASAPEAWLACALVALSVASSGVAQVLSARAARWKDFGAVARWRLAQPLIQLLCQILFGVSFASHSMLSLGDSAGRLVATGILSRHRPSLNSAMVRAGAAWTRYRRAVAVLFQASALNILANQALPLMLPLLFSASKAGAFFVAYRFAIAPALLIGPAFSQVFVTLARERLANGEDLRAISLRAVQALATIFLPVFAVGYVAGPYLLQLILGADWADAAEYLRMLIPLGAIWLLANAMSGLLILRGLFGQSLAFTAVDLVSKCLALLIGYLEGSAERTIQVACLSGILIAAASLFRFVRAAGVEIRELLSCLAPNVLCLVVALAASSFLIRPCPLLAFSLTLIAGAIPIIIRRGSLPER